MVSIVNGLVASAWIWALNIAIQPVQAGIRALIVDCCPPGQQVQANAYASCIICLGTVLGYASGFVSLPNTLPWLGNTQFKGLCVVASVALCLTVAATCLVVKEEIFVTNNQNLDSGSGVFAVFGQILTTAKTMPSKIRRVCMVQFFAWLGWFPFLFYVTT
jgi:solute carrier family 45 protein 1/2/4